MPKAPQIDANTPKKKIDEAKRKAEKLKQQLEDTLGIQLPDLPQTPSGLPQLPTLPNSPSSADAAGAPRLPPRRHEARLATRS